MNGKMSIKEVVKATGLSDNYVRKSIMSGKLEVTKELIPGTKIEKNWISVEEFNRWNVERKSHTQRDDGRNKFVLYMTPDELEKVQKLLEGLECGETLVRANIKPTTEE
jgi:hypothetical protein